MRVWLQIAGLVVILGAIAFGAIFVPVLEMHYVTTVTPEGKISRDPQPKAELSWSRPAATIAVVALGTGVLLVLRGRRAPGPVDRSVISD